MEVSGMRPPRPLPEGSQEILEELLKKAKTKAEFQTVQCVWLRAALGLSAKDVAQSIGWHPSSVRRVQSLFLRDGVEALKRVGRGGGRRHQNLTLNAERELLKSFFERADSGERIDVKEIKQAYEDAVGRDVPKSTVYRMLSRHGWRMFGRRSTRRRHVLKELREEGSLDFGVIEPTPATNIV
jgi:transposase